MAHFRCGDREIDLERREVRHGDDIIPLSANEVGLLRLHVSTRWPDDPTARTLRLSPLLTSALARCMTTAYA